MASTYVTPSLGANFTGKAYFLMEYRVSDEDDCLKKE